ncbi:MAG: RnfABCDGE type electron transport complex subunit D [Flavobacteriales bacterium]|nr:RnfABCDGE type electron transport complex subunit D [Flavobacteriales bacterium]
MIFTSSQRAAFRKGYRQMDPRYGQIICQSIFMAFGLAWLGWEARIVDFLLIFASCLTFQRLFEKWFKTGRNAWQSAMISSLSLCLMFKAGAWWALPVCGLLTVGSKFLIRYNGKHIFNPTNFGILVTILITRMGWVSPGQWGSALIFMILIGALSLAVLFRVGRLDVAFSFLGVYAMMHFFYNYVILGWPMDYFLHQLSSGTLLLFTFFMITDPMTTPRHAVARVAWAGLTGVLAFVLSGYMYIHTAPLWALFFMSPLTPLFDTIFTAPRFTWQKVQA